MNYEIVFESTRINFAKITKDLVHEYLKMVNDENVQKFISRDHKGITYSLEGELEWIQNRLDKNAVIFSMIEKETDKFIGNIEIMHIENGIGELGISITPEMQNKHFGQEAINAILNYAFNELKLDNLYLNVYRSNKRGIHCYEKVGFVIDGTGKTEDDIHMTYKK